MMKKLLNKLRKPVDDEKIKKALANYLDHHTTEELMDILVNQVFQASARKKARENG